LHDEMAADDRVVLLGEDVGNRGGVFRISAGWMDEFGEERVIDTPLAESGIVGVAIGMALHGLLPVAEIQFADFIHPAFDPIGSADVKREGTDLTVVSYGYSLHTCLEAAARLEQEEEGSAEVVDVRTLAPLDMETILASVRKTGKAMVVYEDNRTYGAGAEI